jgi:predicted MarR family transcription regulator
MRWIVRCMAAAGVGNLSPTEVMILHTVRHRDRPKTVVDICLVLGIADTHVATYALRKLESADLVSAARIQKEKAIRITDHGSRPCRAHALFGNSGKASGLRGAGLEPRGRIAFGRGQPVARPVRLL